VFQTQVQAYLPREIQWLQQLLLQPLLISFDNGTLHLGMSGFWLVHHLWRILLGSVGHKIHYVTCSSFTPLQYYHSLAPFLSTMRDWPHPNKGLKIPRQLTSGNRSSLHNRCLLLWLLDNGRVDKPCNYNTSSCKRMHNLWSPFRFLSSSAGTISDDLCIQQGQLV
jgi:hypothetical protein